MPEQKGNFELKLNLIYKDIPIDRVFVKRNKAFFIGSNKKVFWQVLDPKFPSKFKFIEPKGKNNYKINLPKNGEIEKLEKNNTLLTSEEIEKLTKKRSFIIDFGFSGTIVLNADCKIEFFFIKRPVFKISIPPEHKHILKKKINSQDRRAVSIMASLVILWMVLSITTSSITLPELMIEETLSIEYAAQVIMPSVIEEEEEPLEVAEGIGERETLETAKGEATDELEGEEVADESEAVEQVADRREQVARAAKSFRTQMFASIGGIGTTGGVATGVALTGGIDETEGEGGTSVGGDLASTLAGGGVIAKRKISIGKGTKVGIAGKGSGQIEGEFVDAGEAEKLLKTGGLQKGKVSSIKGSARAKIKRKKASLLQVIASYEGVLKYTHSEMLKKYPDLFGKVYLKFIIDEDGKVTNVSIIKAKSTINNPEFEERILQKIRSWKFPKIKKGLGSIEFIYPLIFSR